MQYKRHELVEIVIPAGSTNVRFNWPDIPQLRDDTTQDIIIRGLETYSANTTPVSPISGNAVATIAQLENSFATFYIQDEESVRLVPLMRLLGAFNNNAAATQQAYYESFELQNVKIDWNKSYITASAPYGSVSAISILISVNYKKLPPGEWDQITKNAIPGWND